MGLSKALMEKVAQAYSREGAQTDTVVSTVRYGNVLCSRGSFVPLFIGLIRDGLPLTVTDPRMTRFLMSADDAVGLVEHAFVTAAPGDVFVRKAPASTVEVIARALAQLFDVDPKLRVIGTRHGEKMHETLVGREEASRAQDQGEYFRIPVDDRDLNYRSYFEEGDERPLMAAEYSSDSAERLDEAAVAKLLGQIAEVRDQLSACGLESTA
jgi:UDP-glucose 4-epimerase